VVHIQTAMHCAYVLIRQIILRLLHREFGSSIEMQVIRDYRAIFRFVRLLRYFGADYSVGRRTNNSPFVDFELRFDLTKYLKLLNVLGLHILRDTMLLDIAVANNHKMTKYKTRIPTSEEIKDI